MIRLLIDALRDKLTEANVTVEEKCRTVERLERQLDLVYNIIYTYRGRTSIVLPPV
jgi:hypothetical protein